MEGTYPLLLDGAQAGEVCVSAQGAWTVFEAHCAAQPGIVRISVYGEGKEGYLGVLAPAGEGLALRRRFSRSELRAFPAVIEYAARAGQPLGRDAHIAPEPEPAPVGRDDPGAPPEDSVSVGHDAHIVPEPEPAPVGRGDPGAPPEDPVSVGHDAHIVPPEPDQDPQIAHPPEDADLYWYATTDGALTAFDGEQNLLALPMGDARIPADGSGEHRTIDGWTYVVFRKKKAPLA